MVKTDNSNLQAKLDLRRHFLRKYHVDDRARVMDCCQGDGLIWKCLRSEFPVASYWGLDIKPRKGRLKMASERVLAQPGWTQNVIDIDTYGSPWRHWEALLPNVTQPVTVFLTIGQWQMVTDAKILEVIGLGTVPVPRAIAVKLHDMALSYFLSRARIVEVIEAFVAQHRHARYLGLRLEPAADQA